MERKILIVEDDGKIAELLRDYLTMSGFNVSVLDRGDEVLTEIRNNTPDLIILDIMLPGKDGITICREIRSFSQVPILMLTARVDEIDRVLGLELGADDYMCKPFSPREVIARVKAVLRRTFDKKPELATVVGPVAIRQESHVATVFGKPLKLTPIEFELLMMLADRPGKVFTRNNLMSNLKRYDPEGNIRAIDSHMKNLRKKIDNCSPGSNLIKTIYGIGYSLNVSFGSFEQREFY